MLASARGTTVSMATCTCPASIRSLILARSAPLEYTCVLWMVTPAEASCSTENESFIFCQRQAASALYDRIIQLCGFSPHITQEVPDIRMLLGLVAANLGVSLVPASAMALRPHGVVYCPLADLDVDITVQTVLVWCRKESSPLVQISLLWHGKCWTSGKRPRRVLRRREPLLEVSLFLAAPSDRLNYSRNGRN
jgi:DNA-binding transcriptional LysR family regulator